jgi:hypothetical protein
MPRGPSQAVKDAKAFLKDNPGTTATFLAVKFGLNLSTIYRSDWWKAIKEEACQATSTQ